MLLEFWHLTKGIGWNIRFDSELGGKSGVRTIYLHVDRRHAVLI